VRRLLWLLLFLAIWPAQAQVFFEGPGHGARLGSTVPSPFLSSLSPTSGNIGTVVTISGTNLGASQGGSVVTFSGFAAAPTSWSDTQIVAAVPGGATTGNVIVITNGGQSNGLVFTVNVPLPSIASLSPNSGNIGDSVTIGGSNFGATQGTSTVTFNGAAANVTSWNATQIIVTVPATATSGPVVVTTSAGASAGSTWTLAVPVGVMPKLADLTYPDPACTPPPEQATGKKWYFNPNTAGVSPTQFPGHTAQYWANNPPTSGYVGDAQHPYDNLAYGVFGAGGFGAVPPTGYVGFKPLLSTVSYDQRSTGSQGGTGESPVNGTATGPDWGIITQTTPPPGYVQGDMYPHTPDPNRINPGDDIILESGTYGSIATNNNITSPVNTDASGNTKYVFVHGDTGARPLFISTNAVPGLGLVGTGFVFRDIDVGFGGMTVPKNVSIAGNSTKDIFVVGLSVSNWDPSKGLPNRYGPSTPAYPLRSDGVTPWDVCHVATASFAQCPGGQSGDWYNGSNFGTDISVVGTPGPQNHITSPICWSVIGNTLRVSSRAMGLTNVKEGVIYGNEFRYFTGDAIDAYTVSNIFFVKNLFTDRIDRRDGDHPDGIQFAVSNLNYEQWTFSNFVIAYNSFFARTDPNLPTDPAGNITWGNYSGVFHTDGNYNLLNIFNNEFSLCYPGQGINMRVPASLMANNSAAWAGCPTTTGGTQFWMGGFVNGDVVAVNNVSNGFTYGCADGATFQNNYAIGYTQAGSFAGPSSGNCSVNGTSIVGNGQAGGVFTDATTDPTSPTASIWTKYGPFTDSLLTSSNLNLTPNPNLPLNPLVGQGSTNAEVAGQAQWSGLTVPPVNQKGQPWPGGVPNIGAY
jgi:IPT/TIG domain